MPKFKPKVNTVLAILDHFRIEYLFFSPYSSDYNGIKYLFRPNKLKLSRVGIEGSNKNLINKNFKVGQGTQCPEK
jgi:transposase